MGYDAKTERLISLKKLAGKAQTSNDKGLFNEALPSGLTLSSETVFGQSISRSPSSAALYAITDQVEYIRFECSFIAGSDTSAGRHGFELKLPSDYESNSSNPKAGTYPYINSQTINITSGALQLIPASFAAAYEGKPFYGGTSAKNSGTQIPVLDARDWYLDYFNGIFFQQDPPGTGDHTNNPDYLEAYLYIGQYLNSVVAGGGGSGDPNATYIVLSATGSLTAERVLTAGTGITSTDGGAGSNITLSFDNSVIAALTGSTFSGTVSAPALSGSLTKLQDGTSYIKEGSNVTVTTASNGSITIASTNTTYTAGPGLDLSGTVFSADLKSAGGLKIDSTEIAVDDSIVATISGSTFTGAVKFNGGLSGSLTHLIDGTSYLKAGPSVTVTTASNGSITIASTDTTYTSGDGLDLSGTEFSVDLKSAGGLKIDTTELAIDDSVVATLTGSIFSGDVKFNSGLTGSLQSLIDGTPYLRSGTGISIATASNGAVTITATGGGGGGSPGGSNTQVQFNDAGSFAGDSAFTFNKATNTLAVPNLSGSLTRLSNGTSYLRPGNNISIVSGSDGSITITALSQGGGSGDANVEYLVSELSGSTPNAKLVEAGTGITIITGSNSLTISADASAISGRGKNRYLLTSSHPADTAFFVPFTDFSDVSFNSDLIDIYLNGQLLSSGSAANVTAGTADYSIIASSSMRFSFGLATDDQIYTILSKIDTDCGNGDASAQYLVLSATGSLSNERVFTAGTGITTIDAGPGSPYTVSADNSIIATLTGSTFSGTVSAPALSGSLTKLQDGTSYLIAGSNTTITTGSSGAITISSTGDIAGSGATNRIATWSDLDTLTSDADLTWDGTSLYVSSAGTTLNVQGDANLNGAVVINQSGADKSFRVETQNKSSALQVDAGTDQVLLFSGSLSDSAGHGSSASDPDPRAFTDTNFFVSGSIGSRDTSRRGTSVFGGDLVVSGTITGIAGLSGSIDRSKKSYFLSSDYAARSTISVASSDFSRANYDLNLIDVLVNGQMLHSGTATQITAATRDYYVTGTSSLKFSFDLKIDDIIDVVVYNVKS